MFCKAKILAMKLHDAIILTSVGLFLAASVIAGNDDKGNANEYIDMVLENLRNEHSLVSKFDPLEIPEVNQKNVQIKNGKVRGLSNLYRHGDCAIAYDEETAKVSVEVAVKNVNIEANYRAKALFFWIKGYIYGTVDDLAVRMDISVKNGKASLDSFTVVDLGPYKINKITGMSVVLNWLLKLIANSIAKKSRGKIIHALENGVANAVDGLLEKYRLPL